MIAARTRSEYWITRLDDNGKQRHRSARLRSFRSTIWNLLPVRITNAASESINAKIQWVKYTARGFRNKQNFIHAIYFHCGGLDLAPSATK